MINRIRIYLSINSADSRLFERAKLDRVRIYYMNKLIVEILGIIRNQLFPNDLSDRRIYERGSSSGIIHRGKKYDISKSRSDLFDRGIKGSLSGIIHKEKV